MKRFLTSVLILSGFLAAKQVQAAPEGSTAPVAAQFSVSAELRPEESVVLPGEPVILRFVVRNLSSTERTIIRGGDYWNKYSFQVEVRDEAGNLVPQPVRPALAVFNGLFGGRKFPPHGELTYSLFLPHWATFSKSGRYRVTAKRSLVFVAPGKTALDAFRASDGSVSVPLETSANIEILPRDDAEMGALINRLGATLLSSQGTGSYENETKLGAIHDLRVVPFLIREAEQSDSHNFALYALSQYDDDAAFGELQKLATQSRPKDTRIYEAGLLPSDPNQLRLSAVRHIAWGKNARRTEFLLSLRHDPMDEIRLIVVRNLGSLPVERARAVWREMLNDSNADIKDEAEGYLQRSQAKK